MKNIILVLTLALSFQGFSQSEVTSTPKKFTAHNKGKIYVFWGGNRDFFTDSDIHFRGEGYDFELKDVKAHDKPKGWHIDYINPGRMTIPQTNFRIGYFITDHYNISIGVDHMKYVMYNDRTVDYTGSYPNRGSYGEAIADGKTLLTEDFLLFEHTDGLNYVNVEFSRVDDLSKYLGIRDTDKFQLNVLEGIGAGVLYPRTNATLMNKERHDEFHISGYGISAKAGLNFTFFKHFFIQTELKGGYINMGNIRTTNSSADKASQSFLFCETVIAVGGIFKV
ncbi:hypothetical protein GGR32_001500 [Mesonia hippocampi]|uniref:Uncharacterized protein n=1 Tax=Mesonia hippocampi TaxID=1628250 RepID=A0A840EYT7_9FLAO|nr:hypothetical protein [Mesonia hippocampi]MBB4119204.1 hypothetical protein [Mesonia hippocampi]